MTINEANELLRNIDSTHAELLNCLELLCKEYGYIQGMIIANFRDLESGTKSLVEIQSVIEQIKQELKLL